MTPAEKFQLWLSVYDMEDWAPEVAVCFAETIEFLDFMRPPKWMLEEINNEQNSK